MQCGNPVSDMKEVDSMTRILLWLNTQRERQAGGWSWAGGRSGSQRCSAGPEILHQFDWFRRHLSSFVKYFHLPCLHWGGRASLVWNRQRRPTNLLYHDLLSVLYHCCLIEKYKMGAPQWENAFNTLLLRLLSICQPFLDCFTNLGYIGVVRSDWLRSPFFSSSIMLFFTCSQCRWGSSAFLCQQPSWEVVERRETSSWSSWLAMIAHRGKKKTRWSSNRKPEYLIYELLSCQNLHCRERISCLNGRSVPSIATLLWWRPAGYWLWRRSNRERGGGKRERERSERMNWTFYQVCPLRTKVNCYLDLKMR